jgi:hypothetical protein
LKAIHSNIQLKLLDIDIQDWTHVISIYLDEQKGRVGTRIVESFDATPKGVAGILINILDTLTDKVADSDQIAFEQEILAIFNAGVSERYDHIGKEPIL